MRIHIEIDDALMAKAMRAGPYRTKKDAVEAGLKLLARQAAYREIREWEGKLRWEGDESIDWTAWPLEPEAENQAQPHEPVAGESKGSSASSLSPRFARHDPDRRRARR